MALPEGTKLRKGDIVALHGTVKYDQNEDGYFFLDIPGASTCMVKPGDIAGIVSRRFNVGETVRLRNRSAPLAGIDMIVEAIADGNAFLWLRKPSGTYHTATAGEVELVEPEPEPEPEPAEDEGAAH